MLSPEILRSMRYRMALTQEQCANAVGVSLRAWQNWESPRGSINNRHVSEHVFPKIFSLMNQQVFCRNGHYVLLGHEDDLNWISLQGALRSIRKSLGYSKQRAAKLVHYESISWYAWESMQDSTNFRVMPLCVAELFCMKLALPYRIKSDSKIIEIPSSLIEVLREQ